MFKKRIIKDVSRNQYANQNIVRIKFGKKVKTIGVKGFYNCNLEKIIIPDNIVKIEEKAFTNNRLKKVILSNNLEIIESNTFKNNKIEEIIIPEKVKEIKDEAFKNNQLKKLELSNTTTIGPEAFNNCLLKNINLNKVKNIYGSAFANNEIEKLDLTNVLKIDIFSFYNNNINELIIGPNLQYIPNYAFASNKLSKIFIPSNIKSINDNAFKNNKLEEIILNEGLEYIGTKAFGNAILKELYIPNSVTKIDEEICPPTKIIYKGYSYERNLVQKFGTNNIITLSKIKEILPKIDLNIFNKEDIDVLPLDNDSIKGFVNNKRKLNLFKEELELNTDRINYAIPSEYHMFIKLCFNLGFFKNRNIDDKIREIYKKIDKIEITKIMNNVKDYKYNKKFADMVLNNMDNIENIFQIYPKIYNNFDEIYHGILNKKERQITDLNTQYKRNKNDELKELIDELKKQKKNISYNDIYNYMIDNTFDIKYKELYKIVSYIIGKMTHDEFEKAQNIYNFASNDSEFKCVEKKVGKYTYRWLEGRDPHNLILGHLVNCCAKVGGAGEDIMVQSMTNPKIKNLVIYKGTEIIGKTTVYKNNDYLLCNNIEIKDAIMYNKHTNNEVLEEILDVIIKGLYSQLTEDVNYISIGLGNNDLKEQIINKAITIYYENEGFEGYTFDKYSGDSSEQALIYRKCR